MGRASYKTNKILSDRDKGLIHEMMFGPYKEEWREENGLVDNRDTTIASRLGLPLSAVSKFTDILVNEHFDNVYKLKNPLS